MKLGGCEGFQWLENGTGSCSCEHGNAHNKAHLAVRKQKSAISLHFFRILGGWCWGTGLKRSALLTGKIHEGNSYKGCHLEAHPLGRAEAETELHLKELFVLLGAESLDRTSEQVLSFRRLWEN